MYIHVYTALYSHNVSYCMYVVQYSEANQKWLEDASIRLLCVFALDRFADFVSDQVYTLSLIVFHNAMQRVWLHWLFTTYVLPLETIWAERAL